MPDNTNEYVTMIRESDLDEKTKKLAIDTQARITRLKLKLSYMTRHGLSSKEAEKRLTNEDILPLSTASTS